MHYVGLPGRAPRRLREREKKQRQQNDSPRLGAEVVGDPVAVRDPEVAEGRRRDDNDLEPGRAEVLDCVLDEESGDVTRVTRVGGRQNADPHAGMSRRPNTAGAAITSIANTKK